MCLWPSLTWLTRVPLTDGHKYRVCMPLALLAAPWIKGIGHIHMREEIKHKFIFEITGCLYILHSSCPSVPLLPGILAISAKKEFVGLPK